VFGPERVIFDGCPPPRHYEMNESDQIVLTWRELAALKSMDAAENWFSGAEFTPPPLVIDCSAQIGVPPL